ncbi:MAG: hypothetical protein R3B96_24890 [Pirellulaceae bacterium]
MSWCWASGLIEKHEAFPARVNVEFVEVLNPTELVQRTWERGSGETLACGTGASAVCVAVHLDRRRGAESRFDVRRCDLEPNGMSPWIGSDDRPGDRGLSR